VVVAGTPEQVAECRRSHTGQLLEQILNGGGEVVVAGTPEQVAECRRSHTGQLLEQILNGADGNQPIPRVGTRRRSSQPKCEAIQVWGAREHNLKNA